MTLPLQQIRYYNIDDVIQLSLKFNYIKRRFCDLKAGLGLDTLKAIDLFCGAGGSSYGAQKAGVEIVAGFDIWQPAIKVFKTNFPKVVVHLRDIRDISPREVKNNIGKVDIILASPECTSHSIAKGAREKSDESGDTAFEVIRFAEEFKPTWIVIENVVEIKSWDRYDELLSGLKNLGYFVNDDVILNAKDFEVPQSRKRKFILCSNLRMPSEPNPNGGQIKTASAIIDRSNKYKFTPLRKDGRAKTTVKKAEYALETLGENEPFLIVYYGSGKNGNGGWQRLDEPLRTITTLDRFAYVEPDKEGHKMRMLQPEELKLAMGYGSEFKLDAIEGLTRRERVKLMGNGVCPPVMKAIVQSLTRQKK